MAQLVWTSGRGCPSPINRCVSTSGPRFSILVLDVILARECSGPTGTRL